MNPLKRLGIALYRTLLDQGDLIATQVLLPPASRAIQSHLARTFTGSPVPPQGSTRLATYRGLVTLTVKRLHRDLLLMDGGSGVSQRGKPGTQELGGDAGPLDHSRTGDGSRG